MAGQVSAGQSGADPVVGESEERVEPATAAPAPPTKGPYDDLLCTICGLKACWMTPEAKGTASGKG
jgi:hypothetical protein